MHRARAHRPHPLPRVPRGHALVECLVALTLVAIGGSALLAASAGALALHDAAEQVATVDQLASREAARVIAARCRPVPLPLPAPTPRQQVTAVSTDGPGMTGRVLTYRWHAIGAGAHTPRSWRVSVGVACGP